MGRICSGRRFNKTLVIAASTALLAMLMLASVGAMSNERAGIAVGPDVAPGASGATGWDIFEGHAFAAGQVVPSGVSLAACLGGCEAGYVSEPVIVGLDGRYEGLRVDPGRLAQDAQLEGDVVTFWMVRGEEREPADQAVLFGGLERVRELHLSFVAAPLLPQEEIQEEVPVEEPAPAASASTRTTTTDLIAAVGGRVGSGSGGFGTGVRGKDAAMGRVAGIAGVRDRAGRSAGSGRGVAAGLSPAAGVVTGWRRDGFLHR